MKSSTLKSDFSQLGKTIGITFLFVVLLQGYAFSATILTPPTPSCSTSYTNYIYVSWSSVSGASRYTVRRATSSNYYYSTPIATTTYKYYYDYSATPGVKYYYWINPTNYLGTFCNTGRYGWGTRALVPPTPTASINNASYIRVGWSSVTGAVSYIVRRSTSSSYSTSSQIATTTNTYYYDYSAVAGRMYYYWVLPVGSAGVSYHNINKYDWGKRVAPIIPEPPQPSASVSYTDYIKVTWPSVSNVTKYVIRRGNTSTYSSSTQIATTTSTTYYDYSAIPGKRYYYWVNIVYMGSEYHNANRYDWGTRLTPAIPEPPQPSASTIYSSYIRVSWSSVANVTKYVIRRSTNSNYRDSIQLATTTSTTYYDYSAIAGKTYYYWINVISKGVEYSNASRYDWGRKYIDTLVVPQPTASISYISYIRVGWSSSTGATKYVIRRSLTSNYDNSIVVGTTTNTYYYDYPPLRNTRYYYWVNPVDSAGNIYFNKSKYDYGWRR